MLLGKLLTVRNFVQFTTDGQIWPEISIATRSHHGALSRMPTKEGSLALFHLLSSDSEIIVPLRSKQKRQLRMYARRKSIWLWSYPQFIGRTITLRYHQDT
jgi:hypothetical protein